jgi:hypothetical protein
VWLILRQRIPNFLGTGMADTFHGGLFLFFLAGIAFQVNRKWTEHKLVLFASALSFLLLAPFWSRVEVFNSISGAPHFLKNYYVGAIYTILVALTGSMAIMIYLNLYWEKISHRISYVFISLGINTLGIYALHGYFLTSGIPVITPILISLLITLLVSRVPVVRTILLGKFGVKSS